MDWIETTITVVRTVVVFLVIVQVVPILVWLERRGSAMIQHRRGPNRVTILGKPNLGLVQPLADAIKFATKEDIIPANANKFFYILAPAVLIVPAFLTFAVIPFGQDITIGDHVIRMQVADLNVGILYILGVASLGVYGIVLAGWASNSKYSLLGGLRASAQMISYEIAMGLSIVGVLLVAESVRLNDIVEGQRAFFGFGWYVFPQFLGFIIFVVAVFAETNRLPFDLPEGESEIVAGYHTEYGSLKFLLFMFAEYINIITASAMITTLYFGGWSAPGQDWIIAQLHGLAAGMPTLGPVLQLVASLMPVITFTLKMAFWIFFFVWVRWTLPRFRYDQLMRIGWKVMLPLALLNIFLTAILLPVWDMLKG